MTTTSAQGGTGGMTSSGGTGGCATSADNVYENSSADDLTTGCIPVGPLPDEDGTFAVTVFGPFAKPFSLAGFTFGAYKSSMMAVSDPWTVSVTVVPAGGDPTTVDPNTGSAPMPLTLVDSTPVSNDITSDTYSITLAAPVSVAACESVVVALRNTKGPPDTALTMCGSGSDHVEANRWWALSGTMPTMASYGAGFDRNWRTALLPAP